MRYDSAFAHPLTLQYIHAYIVCISSVTMLTHVRIPLQLDEEPEEPSEEMVTKFKEEQKKTDANSTLDPEGFTVCREKSK